MGKAKPRNTQEPASETESREIDTPHAHRPQAAAANAQRNAMLPNRKTPHIHAKPRDQPFNKRSHNLIWLLRVALRAVSILGEEPTKSQAKRPHRVRPIAAQSMDTRHTQEPKKQSAACLRASTRRMICVAREKRACRSCSRLRSPPLWGTISAGASWAVSPGRLRV